MSLTNEDRDLIDRQFDNELNDQEQATYHEKLAQNEEFRQAVYLHELIEERARAVGREQLKHRLKEELRAQRSETSTDDDDTKEAKEATVRPMFPGAVKWAIAASVVVALAAALFLLLPQRDGVEGPSVAEEKTPPPTEAMPGQQTETPTYGGAEVYGQYDIPTEGATMIQTALLQVDASRPSAQYQMTDGTLYIYYPSELPEDATLELTEEDSIIFVTIDGNTYQIDPETLSSDEVQELTLVE